MDQATHSPTDPGPRPDPVMVFLRILLLGGLLAWCALILAPFTSVLLWALILVVSLYPVFTLLSRRLGGRTKLAAAILVLCGVALVAVPGFIIGDSLVGTVQLARTHFLSSDHMVPALPVEWSEGTGLRRAIADRWPTDDGSLAELLAGHVEGVRQGAMSVLLTLGRFGADLMKFLLSIVVAGVLLAYAQQGVRLAERLFVRALGPSGTALMAFSASTIRTVAKGILGVALIQTAMLALGLFVAGIPAAGLLVVLGLMLAIVQVGVGPIAIGVIVYAFAVMDTVPAVLLTIWLVLTMIIDNIIKPILLGRGAEVPTVVIFLGAIGGFLLSGIVGLFTGAVVLSIGYRILMLWLEGDDASPFAN